VQLKTAKANLNAARAAHTQAISNKGSADITVGYTLITAPVNGLYRPHTFSSKEASSAKGKRCHLLFYLM
jgi:membrane fusion protein (multidrug efflux system)